MAGLGKPDYPNRDKTPSRPILERTVGFSGAVCRSTEYLGVALELTIFENSWPGVFDEVGKEVVFVSSVIANQMLLPISGSLKLDRPVSTRPAKRHTDSLVLVVTEKSYQP